MKFVSRVLALIFAIRLWKCSIKTPLEYLRRCYGQNLIKAFRGYEDASKKLRKCELDIKFLETCKSYNIVPKFLRFKLYKKSLRTAGFYRSWQSKLLVNEIQSKRREVNKLNKKIRRMMEPINVDLVYS